MVAPKLSLGEACKLFTEIRQHGVRQKVVLYVSILTAFSNSRSLEWGKHIHAHLVGSEVEVNIFVGNALFGMYASSGSIVDAFKLFERMPAKDIVSWNAAISQFAQHGKLHEVLKLFEQMQQQGLSPNRVTYAGVLNACGIAKVLEMGKHIHAKLIQSAEQMDVFVGSNLVALYMKCGSIEEARQVFDGLHQHNIISYTLMISGYVEHDNANEALKMFCKLQDNSFIADKVTYASVLSACIVKGDLGWGKHIHANLIRDGMSRDIFVGSNLVSMYAKCGDIGGACDIFNRMPVRNLVTWTALISVYAEHGDGHEVIEMLDNMNQQGWKLDKVAYISVFTTCANSGAFAWVKCIHAHQLKDGFGSDGAMGNTLVGVYTKCGSIEYAQQLFDRLQVRDIVSWTSVIAGYIEGGKENHALILFERVQSYGLIPDKIMCVAILTACGNVGALEWGKHVHMDLPKFGLQLDVLVGNTLVGTYAKCGSLTNAHLVFKKMVRRDIVSWNALISGYAQHGRSIEVNNLFKEMQHEALKPDNFTFISMLVACNHAGYFDEALHTFHYMSHVYGFWPEAEHYACMIDLIARAGCLHEAKDLLDSMSCAPDLVVWTAFLGACGTYGDLVLGEWAVSKLLTAEPHYGAAFILLSNLYARVGRKMEIKKVIETMGYGQGFWIHSD